MKTLIVVAALLFVGSLAPIPAECVYCGNLFCMNSSACFDGCACAVKPDGTGVCVAVR